MKSKAFNFFLLLLLSGANITNAQNKVYGIVQVNDKGFSTNDVFIYDDNNKFLTTPDEKGYYEFFTEKKKMKIGQTEFRIGYSFSDVINPPIELF